MHVLICKTSDVKSLTSSGNNTCISNSEAQNSRHGYRYDGTPPTKFRQTLLGRYGDASGCICLTSIAYCSFIIVVTDGKRVVNGDACQYILLSSFPHAAPEPRPHFPSVNMFERGQLDDMRPSAPMEPTGSDQYSQQVGRHLPRPPQMPTPDPKPNTQPPPTTSSTRQRAAIACLYCRRRKVRKCQALISDAR